MPQSLDEDLLATIEAHATEIARGAGGILGGYFGNPLQVEYKDENERDPVTNVDKETQDYLTKSISERFPDHSVLGEEDPEDKQGQGQEDPLAADFVWVLDPLDGTKNFIGGLPVYACSIGVIYQGFPVAGAVFVPWPNKDGGAVLHARRGNGAFIDDEPISVFQSDEPKGNTLVTLPGGFGAFHRFRKPMRGKVGELRVTGSIAFELAMTARGVLQYSITTGPRLWDVAGGVMLVIEAGGLVMRGHRTGGLVPFRNSTRWEPMDSFLPSWKSGATTMRELRRWSAPIAVGSPAVVRYVTSNLRTRLLLKHRLLRAARRLRLRKRAVQR